MGSKLLNQPVIVTLGELLQVSPKITKFLLHHTSKRVDTPNSDQQSTSATTSTKRIFKQEDVGIDVVAVDCNTPILPVQIGTGTLDDIFLDVGSRVNIIIKEVQVHSGLPTLKPTPYQ